MTDTVLEVYDRLAAEVGEAAARKVLAAMEGARLPLLKTVDAALRRRAVQAAIRQHRGRVSPGRLSNVYRVSRDTVERVARAFS